MQHQKDKNLNSRPGTTASSAVSLSGTEEDRKHRHQPSHPTLKHRQILKGDEICCRFDQVSGKRPPKRMTTGKFVYLGPTDKAPDSPL